MHPIPPHPIENILENHRSVRVGRDHWRSESNSLAKAGPPPVGHAGKQPGRCWVHPEKEIPWALLAEAFPHVHVELCSSWCPLPLDLLLGTTRKSLAPSTCHQPIRYLWMWEVSLHGGTQIAYDPDSIAKTGLMLMVAPSVQWVRLFFPFLM